MAEKLKTSEHEHLSALAGLKTTEAQVEDQRKLLYTTKLNLATKKAMVLSLKAELQKAKVEARTVREAAKVVEEAAYERGVLETEQRLAEEVTEVCRDYCTITWMEAFNSAGVFANSELWRAENVYFPKHIREVPADPPSTALPLPPSKQVSSIQDLTLDAEVSTRVGRGKEGLPLANDAQSEDTFTIRDVVSQAKVVEKPKARDAKSKTADTKEDPQPKKKVVVGFSFMYLLLFPFPVAYVIACSISSFELMNELFLLFPGSLLFMLFILIIIANKFELLLHFQCVLTANHY